MAVVPHAVKSRRHIVVVGPRPTKKQTQDDDRKSVSGAGSSRANRDKARANSEQPPDKHDGLDDEDDAERIHRFGREARQ